jgi:hypothetical protein
VYRCSVCTSPVTVLQGTGGTVVVRACGCAGPIVADLSARVEGRGGLR